MKRDRCGTALLVPNPRLFVEKGSLRLGRKQHKIQFVAQDECRGLPLSCCKVSRMSGKTRPLFWCWAVPSFSLLLNCRLIAVLLPCIKKHWREADGMSFANQTNAFIENSGGFDSQLLISFGLGSSLSESDERVAHTLNACARYSCGVYMYSRYMR